MKTFSGTRYLHLVGKIARYRDHTGVYDEEIVDAAASGPHGDPDQGIIVLTARGNILDSRQTTYTIVGTNLP